MNKRTHFCYDWQFSAAAGAHYTRLLKGLNGTTCPLQLDPRNNIEANHTFCSNEIKGWLVSRWHGMVSNERISFGVVNCCYHQNVKARNAGRMDLSLIALAIVRTSNVPLKFIVIAPSHCLCDLHCNCFSIGGLLNNVNGSLLINKKSREKSWKKIRVVAKERLQGLNHLRPIRQWRSFRKNNTENESVSNYSARNMSVLGHSHGLDNDIAKVQHSLSCDCVFLHCQPSILEFLDTKLCDFVAVKSPLSLGKAQRIVPKISWNIRFLTSRSQ